MSSSLVVQEAASNSTSESEAPPAAAAAALLHRTVIALQLLRHQPQPRQLHRLCTLLDTHCTALQARPLSESSPST